MAVKVVLITAPPDEGPGLARRLVEERLAACVNLLPAQSLFRWDGAVREASEGLLIVKTTAVRLEALRARVLELHRYDCPEFIVLSVEDGLPEYLEWIGQETRP